MSEHNKKFIEEAELVVRRELLVAQKTMNGIERNRLRRQIWLLKNSYVILNNPRTVYEWLKQIRKHYP